MDETEEHKEHEYLAKLVEATDKAKARLSELGLMELRRRLATSSAIIHSVRPMFYQTLTMQKEIESRRDSRVPLRSLLACLIVGGILHYLLWDKSKTFDFTLGAFIAVYGLVSYVVYGLTTDRMGRELAQCQRGIDEMLYRWLANGATDARFWQLRRQIDLDTGDIDFDSDTYRKWWYEMYADLLDSIIGHTPGDCSWRPRSSSW